MSLRAPRTEFAVGLFLLLALATVLVLAMASTNGKFGFGQSSGYPLKARFTGIGQLRDQRGFVFDYEYAHQCLSRNWISRPFTPSTLPSRASIFSLTSRPPPCSSRIS